MKKLFLASSVDVVVADIAKHLPYRCEQASMRKRFKRKQRSCGLCKPHQVGWEHRWKASEFAGLKEFEKEKRVSAYKLTYAFLVCMLEV